MFDSMLETTRQKGQGKQMYTLPVAFALHVILLGAILSVMLLGHYAFGLSTDDLFGVVSGTAGNPAILVYANRALQSDRIDVAFATIFPSMTILKIACVQIAIGVYAP